MGQERHVSYYWHGTVREWTGGVGLGVVIGMDTLFILRSQAWWWDGCLSPSIKLATVYICRGSRQSPIHVVDIMIVSL